MSTPNTANIDKAKQTVDTLIAESKKVIEVEEKKLVDCYNEYAKLAANKDASPTEKQRAWINLMETRMNVTEAKLRLNEGINAAMYFALTEHGVAITNLSAILLNANTKIQA